MIWENGVLREPTEKDLEKMERNAGEDIQLEIQRRKEILKEYDYIGVKIAMGVATKEEYAKEIAYTQQIRKEINQLEAELLEESGKAEEGE